MRRWQTKDHKCLCMVQEHIQTPKDYTRGAGDWKMKIQGSIIFLLKQKQLVSHSLEITVRFKYQKMARTLLPWPFLIKDMKKHHEKYRFRTGKIEEKKRIILTIQMENDDSKSVVMCGVQAFFFCWFFVGFGFLGLFYFALFF